ncbi:MarR family winged helix-turn-helix transcriptional regulator [Rhodococcus sp. NPDC127530]|uniref:MarR family winged helix-turn-helix transcriptional regulator n=1 Tax=unclassified Rhodococcus (in: high G+C Gram-positive bacteria) TaxID=192944 RepID=UPI003639B032
MTTTDSAGNRDATELAPMEPATLVVDAVSRLQRAVHQIGTMRLAPWNLTLSSYAALRIMADQPSLSLIQLSRRAFVRPQTMTRMVTQLEKRGYIERRQRPENERALSLHVTEEGREALAEMGARVNKINSTFTDLFDDEQIEQLNTMLRQCAHAIEAEIKEFSGDDVL